MKRFIYNWFKQVVLFFAQSYLLFEESLDKTAKNIVEGRCDICKMKFIDEDDKNECKKCHKIVCGGCMMTIFLDDGSVNYECLICDEEGN